MEMTASRILDGKRVAQTIRSEVAERVRALRARGVVPGLVVVLVGDDPASQVYVKNKDKAGNEEGFAVRTVLLPATTAQRDMIARVGDLNRARAETGIHVQRT